ncbi:putative ankyrin repeat protein [Rosellinia necatrix]|uniref:Putative ankyrin repeat protein n=1 Tax=Rosellinia necatrix TaxID=77044 RepID=A0A1W2TBZ6_ROSNE|nr:putative ankyrin repeat protein [Rosellinia necatrix]
MSIWDDAGAIPPMLDIFGLQAHVDKNPDILDAYEPGSGLTPLACALISGNVTTVKLLLQNGASPDKKVLNGRTPMYFAASANGNRRRMIQLLLDENPATFDDAGPSSVGENTPLMEAVKRDDPEAVKLLIQRGASTKKKNAQKKTAKDLVDESKRNSAKVKKELGTSPSRGIGGLITYIKRWALPVLGRFRIFRPLVDIFDAAARSFFGIAILGPLPGQDITEPKTTAEFKKNLENMVNRGGLQKFFPPGSSYVLEVAERATEIKDDPKNILNSPAQVDALAKLALYQPVLYCDDSGSMWDEDNGPGTNKGDRWRSQIELVKIMSDITTRAVPNNGGCHLRFINKNTPDSNDLDKNAIERTFNEYGRGTGATPIGTRLAEHVLDQLVYNDLNLGTQIKRPLLVMCITDGFPTWESAMEGAEVGSSDKFHNEDPDRFRKEIRRCVKLLDDNGYRHETVLFSLSRIGNMTDESHKLEADRFWDGLRSDDQIHDVLFMTEDILDAKFHAKQDQKDLETWMLTTLLSPLQSLLY